MMQTHATTKNVALVGCGEERTASGVGMRGKYSAYAEYKNSGVEWLGKIPRGWNVFRGKFVFSELAERSKFGDEVLLSVSEYYGVKPRGDVIDTGEFLSRAESLVGYKKCYRNDLVMNIMLAWKRGLGVTKYDGIVSPAYSVFRFTEKVSPDYMHYLLRTDLYTGQFKTCSTGVIDSRLRLYPESFANVSVLMPRISEQQKIANFLDHETAKIDTLIAKQQQLIKLLKEKRQAVISHAVTKGLNPDARMKDSGVEWLGEVPEHWKTVRIKQVASFITSGPRGWSDFISEEGNDIFLQSGDLNHELEILPHKAKRVIAPKGAEGVRTKLIEGDVVVCITGANTGRVAVVQNLTGITYINQHLSLIRPIEGKVVATFIGYALSSQGGRAYFDVMQYGLKEGLSLANVAETPLSLPPLNEQKSIVQELHGRLSGLSRINGIAENQVELLKERRTALISAAVTGKIDVRNWDS